MAEMRYFSHDINALYDIKIGKMMTDYGFIGFGYYWAIVAEVYRNGGRYAFADLQILAKNTNIEVKKLKSFINQCIEKYTHEDVGLFKRDGDYFTSVSILKRLNLREQKSNARKGKTDLPRIDFEGLTYVNLTEPQYEKLCAKYTKAIADSAIKKLDYWLSREGKTAKQYIGKNHYNHFRIDGWCVKNALKEAEENKRTDFY